MNRSLGLAAALLLGLAGAAQGQRLSGSIRAEQLTLRFRDSTGSGQQTGTLMGASLGLGFGRLHLGLGGKFGTVKDPESGFVPRELRITAFTAGLELADWIETGLEVQARREQQGDAVTLQRMAGPFARLLADFGGTGLGGVVELAVYPFSSSSNTPALSAALRAAVGARYAQLNGPIMVQLTYRFTRLDFQESNQPPLTQDEGIALEFGLRKF